MLKSPLRITSATEMREIDRLSEQEYGIDAMLLMENAGRAATQVLLDRYPNAGRETEILVFAGKGNNAGDAFVVARRLITLERRVRVFHLDNGSHYRGATLRNFEILKKLRARLTALDSAAELEEFFQANSGPFVAVDGILGTGLKGRIEGIFFDVVELMNRSVSEIVALDIPTGVCGETGEVRGGAIQATLTVSFGFPKLGHFLPPGAGKRGELVNVDISLPPRFRAEGDKFLLMPAKMAELIHERDRYGHKNSFGHTLMVGGSPGRLGAIALAARAAHRMGTGLVTAATWQDCLEPLMLRLPDETMTFGIRPFSIEARADLESYRKMLSQVTSIVVGPGLGLRPEGKDLLKEILSSFQGPVVLDADALNLVSDHGLHDFLIARKGQTVLTPHMGEMARLLGVEKEEVVANPVAALRNAVSKTHSVVLLKGAATLISSPDEKLYLNHYPNDGMATAGSGDVLAGMIGGLLGQRMDAFQATQLGVYLHSLAGDLAAQSLGHRGMTASDLIGNIGYAFSQLKKPTPPSILEGSDRLR
ncbi:MAG: NAD(P)H-hydrate dehydratase [Oligoflexia bacterium]